MHRQLRFTEEAERQLEGLADNPAFTGLHKQVLKTLGLLELNTRHPGLHTHEYDSLHGANGERVWEAYAQNKTPGLTGSSFITGRMNAPTKSDCPC